MIAMNPSLKILVVEDDLVLGKSIQDSLTSIGHDCELIADGATGVETAKVGQFDIVLLDLALEDDSGLGVLRCVREADPNCSIIIMTPINFNQERLAGLEAGADDFLIKPFASSELRARVQAAMVKSRAKPKSLIEVGPVIMDLTSRKVTSDGRSISLTPTEFRILEILLRNHNRVVTRRMLCEYLWNPDWEGVTNVIEVHINRLRSKLSGKGSPKLIHTVRGSGYEFRWEPDSVSTVPTAAVVEQ